MVNPQKGYTRVRIHSFDQVPLLLRALDLAWELRARSPKRQKPTAARSRRA
jgi:hypothetical protein